MGIFTERQNTLQPSGPRSIRTLAESAISQIADIRRGNTVLLFNSLSARGSLLYGVLPPQDGGSKIGSCDLLIREERQ
jgi:hypothetical protein